MKNKVYRRICAAILSAAMAFGLAACGNGGNVELNNGEMQQVDLAELEFPLKEKATLTGMISYPANTESNPNNRTICKRLQ